MGDWFTVGSTPKWDDYRSSTWEEIGAFMRSLDALTGLTERKTAQFPDARFCLNLKKLEDYEKEQTYWTLPRFPMIQQIFKACLVSGARFTMIVRDVFLFSFVLIEILLICARLPLNGDGRSKATKLLREWGNMERVPEMCQTDRKTGIFLRPVRPKNWLTKSLT
jgi:hypothetical protein